MNSQYLEVLNKAYNVDRKAAYRLPRYAYGIKSIPIPYFPRKGFCYFCGRRASRARARVSRTSMSIALGPRVVYRYRAEVAARARAGGRPGGGGGKLRTISAARRARAS